MAALMSKSNLVAFRVPAELQDAFNQAVAASGGDRTAWLVDALRSKLSQPESNPQSRMLALLERMEVAAAALAGGKQGIPPTPYNETAVIGIIADTIREGFDNGRIIAERLNEAGYQTKAGKAWDKDIYSAWKRQGRNAEKLSAAL
nr:MAG TPA: Arc-like DNA binding domain protein [Caudoviricetes sp.]